MPDERISNMSASLPLLDKRAIVTGGSRGIGAAIVRRLAADGAQVAFTYSASPDAAHNLVAEIQAKGGKAFAINADSGDVEALQGAIRAAATQMGGLDILVNNAGVMRRATVETFELADFDSVIAVNVRAPFFAMQEAARHMQAGGRIINVSSNTAVRSAVPGSSIYAMSKAAVTSMTRALAHEFGPRGITVNAIQPGPTSTDMTAGGEELRAVPVPLTRPIGHPLPQRGEGNNKRW
jgi:3-oxoacyl-[acyl-carrier protein] reductase